MDYNARYHEWMQYADAGTRAELRALSEQEREERFYTELEFGTAGLRGILGAGTNRMNAYVVRRATKGLADYLCAQPGAKEQGVAIAYDSRRESDTFALEAALVLCANGFRAYLFESLRAVPQLSFAVQHLNCAAGIVITASHNPAAYNGYKVYAGYGGQVNPQQAAGIFERMQKVEYFNVETMPREKAQANGLLRMIGAEVDEAYYAATQSLLLSPDALAPYRKQLKLVYTPLHGTGNKPVREMLRRIGVGEVHVVPEQELPDAAFPTVSAPNPEDPAAFRLAEKLADEVGAGLIIATDPDADRMGVAVREAGGAFRTLSGNQIAVLLLHHILSSLRAQGKLPANALVARSLVSTPLADAIAAKYGAKMEVVLTGFRFISEIVEQCARTGAHTFLFGFEESYGFLAGGYSRDKDAICAAMLLAEAAADCLRRGSTLLQTLHEIYEEYGWYREAAKSYTLAGKEGVARISAAMQALRGQSPAQAPGQPPAQAPGQSPAQAPGQSPGQASGEIGGSRVLVFEDYEARKRTDTMGRSEPLYLPQADMLRMLLEEDSWVIVRPSGTEPKLKLYTGVRGRTEADAGERSRRLLEAADQLLRGLLGEDE